MLNVLQIDLRAAAAAGRPFDLIVSVCYLWRPLFAEFPRLLVAGGTLGCISRRLRNWSDDKPPAAFLAERRGARGWPTGSKLSIPRKAGWAMGGTTRYWWPANRSLAGL